jgi:O-antigen/teichoic acid export membrane protein
MLRKLVSSGTAWFARSAKLKATAYYGGSSLVCQAFRFTGLLVSTRLISAGQFGVFATALMVVGFCSLCREFGQNSALLSRRDALAGYSKLHFRLTVCLGLVAATALVAFCFLLPPLTGLRPLLPLLVVTLLADAVQQTPQVLAQQAFRFRELAVIELSATGTWLATILAGAFSFRDVTTLLFARMLETLVRGIALFAWWRADMFQGEITPAMWRYFGRFARVLGPQAWL